MQKQFLPACVPVTTHGVRGEMKVRLEVDELAFLKPCKVLYRDAAGTQPVRVKSLRPMNTMALLLLEEASSIDEARPFINRMLYFDRADVRLPEGAVYISDLLGCEVRDADTGAVYGRITQVTHPGPQDIYTVRNEAGREFLFPAVPAFLGERRVEEEYITVRPIPGLFDEPEAVGEGEE